MSPLFTSSADPNKNSTKNLTVEKLGIQPWIQPQIQRSKFE